MADQNRSTVVGVFQNRGDAQCALDGLKRAGFTDDQIGMAMRNEEGMAPGTKDTKAGTGAVTGAVTGGVLGGLLGAAVSLLVPGVGPVLAAGILGTTLAGVAGGAIAGGLIGGLVGMGVPEEEARFYDQEFKAGRVIVTAQADGRYDEAYNILHDCGAYDANTEPQRLYGTESERENSETIYGTNAPADQPVGMENRVGTEGRMGTSDEETMRLREEQLRTRKEPVQTGQVNVRKEVKTETKNVEVPVTREEVVVERHPVEGDQPAREDIGEGDEIHVPVMEEQVRVEKRPVVREEVSVHKRPVQETEQVSEDVRREEARIDRQGDADVESDTEIEDDDTNP